MTKQYIEQTALNSGIAYIHIIFATQRRWQARLWLARWLVRLAAWVLGCEILFPEWEVDL